MFGQNALLLYHGPRLSPKARRNQSMEAKQMKSAILGAGRVGGAIALDLAATPGFDVIVADLSEERLGPLAERGLEVERLDLGDEAALRTFLGPVDLVVGAAPSRFGFDLLERVIDAGKPVADISFFDRDPFELETLAKERDVVAAIDAGVAPGLSNLILGHAVSELERVERFTCYVGGLPVERRWPFEYKAPFAPEDVIEEYTRPVRQRIGGKEIVRPALSDLEYLDFPGLGTLEAFNTDGLRTLLRTLDVPEMVEKTMRYPGHRDLVWALREAGFFSAEKIEVGGQKVSPLELSSKLLFPRWHLDETDDELVVMRIEIEGAEKGGARVRKRWDLLDRRDGATGVSSMARTTGYTAAAVARLLAGGHYDRAGIAPLELIGQDTGAYRRILDDLGERGIRFEESTKTLG